MVVLLLGAPSIAHANAHDVSIRAVGRPASGLSDDPATLRYLALADELMLTLMPTPQQTAESLGAAGYEVSVASQSTYIHADAPFWLGQAGLPVLQSGTAGAAVPGMLWTPVLRVRKGLGGSTDVGFFSTFLPQSHLLAVGGELKVAVHETSIFWLPSIAGRLAVHRLLGARELDAFAVELGALVSYPIGIFSWATVTPFVGYSQIFLQINPVVLDETPFAVSNPQNDQFGGPNGSLYNFPTVSGTQNTLPRWVVGVRALIFPVTVHYEASFSTYSGAPSAVIGHTIKLGFEG